MLIIRQEQMEVFDAAAWRAFEDQMVAHLADFRPLLCQSIGQEQMRRVIRRGIESARGYGFDRRGPMRLYLELMLVLGSAFDTDPQYPWAGEILKERDSGSQMDRAERLYERVIDYQFQVAGPDDVYRLKALTNIRAFASQPLNFAPNDLVPFMLDEIGLIYPEKAAFLGSEALMALILKRQLGARNQRLTTPRGMALVVMLMLGFGHGCGGDPLYPWIGEILRDKSTSDPDAKAKLLEENALLWVGYVVADTRQTERS
ncbi:hypothetical protein [uncultured Thiodictyon sp.]|uniref:hypothetical protein n=1 Tax=uncultured Thiodictyon sp. TaxID=1846217 RepID=UPI0025FA4CB9|nr:hypothetical protein [uncultured Thiodictyon sp.]